MISIIINTKNEQQNLPRLLKSILKSSVLPEEIIIVDNFSTDKTVSEATKLIKHAKFNIPYSIVNLGPERSTQKNQGAAKAKGKYLLFLDADMELPHKLLHELEKLAEINSDAVIIPEQAIGHDFWGKSIALERNCYQGDPLIESPRLIKKTVFKKLDGFDENLIAGEDWDLCLRLQNDKASITRSKQHLLHHEPVGLQKNISRKWYYTQHIKMYADKHPRVFNLQSNFIHRLAPLWKHKLKLMRQPLHTVAFLTVKLLLVIKWKTTKV